MSLSEMQARINARIWQSIARSGVDVSGLSAPDMEKLVGAVSDGILTEMDDILGQAAGRPASAHRADQADDDDDETVLWEGRPFLSLSVQYQITSERVRLIEGLFGKSRRDLELIRIRDIDHKQNLTERTLNIGDVFISSNDATDPEVVLHNVSDPFEVHEILRKAVLKARRKYNLSFREEM